MLRADGHGVEPACKVLREQGVQVAPRTYRSWRSKAPAARTVTDATVVNALRDAAEKPESLYGRRKMTAWLRREGHAVARCTVDRLMHDEAMNGLVRGRKRGEEGFPAGPGPSRMGSEHRQGGKPRSHRALPSFIDVITTPFCLSFLLPGLYTHFSACPWVYAHIRI